MSIKMRDMTCGVGLAALVVALSFGCDESTNGSSVGCLLDSDCPESLHCLQEPGVCVQCLEDGQCALSGQCDEQKHTCVVAGAECQVDEDCEAPSLCVVASCDGGKCSAVPGADGVACDDGDDCTTGDACLAGTCEGKQVPGCGLPFCYGLENGTACDDANECTTDDVCDNGACAGVADPSCAPVLDADEDGFSVEQGDCNDTNPDTYPSAPELCDELDNDCDSETDEECVASPCFSTGCFGQICSDADIDSPCEWLPEFDCVQYSTCGTFGLDGSCAWAINEEYLQCLEELCQPSDEVCDGADNNCDGNVDEGCGLPCGGLLGTSCMANEYCQYEPDTCFDPGASGTCVTVPVSCPAIPLPVCGCDQVTYSSWCEMEASHVSLWYEGSCVTEACKAVGKENYGLCLNILGWAYDGTACWTVFGCDCGANCPWIYASQAECEQMCGLVPPECATDGDCPAGLVCKVNCGSGTCAGQCLADDSSDQDGDGWGLTDGDCSDGDSTIHPTAPELCDEKDNDCNGEVDDSCSSQACGGLAGSACPPGQFCRFSTGVCASDQPDGICTPIPGSCGDVFHPVCGCNMVTYTSECAAGAKKVSVMKKGTCLNQKCKDLSGVEFGDCDAQMGYGRVNGECAAIVGCSCGLHCDGIFPSWADCLEDCQF